MPLIPAEARDPRLCGLRTGVMVPTGATAAAAGILLTATRQGDR